MLREMARVNVKRPVFQNSHAAIIAERNPGTCFPTPLPSPAYCYLLC